MTHNLRRKGDIVLRRKGFKGVFSCLRAGGSINKFWRAAAPQKKKFERSLAHGVRGKEEGEGKAKNPQKSSLKRRTQRVRGEAANAYNAASDREPRKQKSKKEKKKSSSGRYLGEERGQMRTV